MKKNKSGFTLVELLIAILIFSFMMISLATIYATCNRHMFQSYRENVVKSNLNIAMKTIQNAISRATRIDAPSSGNSSNELKFATNVDTISNCYPLVPGTDVEWHYFWLNVTDKKLYHRTGTISTTGMSICGTTWNTGTYNSGSDILLLEYAATDATVMGGTGEDYLFSRKQTYTQYGQKTEPDQVRVVLKLDWQPPKSGDIDLTKAARPIQVTFDTTIKPNITGQN